MANPSYQITQHLKRRAPEQTITGEVLGVHRGIGILHGFEGLFANICIAKETKVLCVGADVDGLQIGDIVSVKISQVYKRDTGLYKTSLLSKPRVLQRRRN